MPMPSEFSSELQQSTTIDNNGNSRQQQDNNGPTVAQQFDNNSATWGNKGVSRLINSYMTEFTGTFYLKDLDEYVRSGLGCDKLPRPYQFYRSKVLSQMAENGRLERTSRGGYRIVDREVEELDFLSAEAEPHPLKLPLGLNELVNIHGKEIILICGNPDSGKTAFAFDIALANMVDCCTSLKANTYNKERGIYHFVSEMGPAAFKQKLQAIGPDMPEMYHTYVKTLVYKPNSIQDQVNPAAINLVDYLEPRNADYREIVPTIDSIFKRLDSGVCVICIQQHPGQNPRGGLGVFEKPRLIVSLANDRDRNCKMATILKGKNNITSKSDLIGLEMDYVVQRKGTRIVPLGKAWEWRRDNQRPRHNTDW